MSCFKLTKNHCKAINSALSNFWWSSCSDKRSIHWISWDRLCRERINGGLGFRDIEDFNQALLAKQTWRIIQNPESLIAQVYKAKYFPHSLILSCSAGRRPSYAWRSVLFGRDLLTQGLLRSIGTSQDTLASSEKWIFDTLPRHPVFKPGKEDTSLRVSNLISRDGCWNQHSLFHYFSSQETRIISAIPTSPFTADGYIWPFTQKGSYSVQSGYKFIRNLKTIHNHQPDPLKTRIWRMLAPRKIKIFWWRVLTDSLPIGARLYDKHVPLDPICSLCRQQTETVLHMLFLCDQAQKILDLAHFPLPLVSLSQLTVSEIISYLLDDMDSSSISNPSRQSIPWLLWEIWKSRNNSVFNRIIDDPSVIISRVISDSDLWLDVHRRTRLYSTRSSSSSNWQRPPQNTMKCNIHVDWHGCHYLSGFAWLTRDESGNAIHHVRDSLPPLPSLLEASLTGVLKALSSLRDLHYDNVMIECSSRKAIEAIKNPKDWPSFRNCLHQISLLSQSFVSISFDHVSRNANIPVTEIASSVSRDGRFNSYLSIGGPAWIHSMLMEDLRLSS